MNHRWTDEDHAVAAERYLAGEGVAVIAADIGTTPGSLRVHLSERRINKGRENCSVCHVAMEQPAAGRKRQWFCSTPCRDALNAAYATNARIDGREITHCDNCGARLIPPWTTKKKWCSRACGQQAWYVSVVTNATKKHKYRGIIKQSKQRRIALNSLSDVEFDWLYTLRVDGDAPAYWIRKLRAKLALDSKADLLRYARAVEVFA